MSSTLALSACVGTPAEGPAPGTDSSPPASQNQAANNEQIAVLREGFRAPLNTPVPRIEGLSARLRGMHLADVIELLGEPSFRRRDDPAEIWQYRGRRCILDVFLFRTGDIAKVNHTEIRTTGVARPEDPDCYADIFGSRPFPPTGNRAG